MGHSIHPIRRFSLSRWLLVLAMGGAGASAASAVRGANISAADFFAPATDAGAKLPGDQVYPRGREFPYSFFSVGGGSGDIKPDVEQALQQVKKDGCTMIGPQYELNDRILQDAKKLGLKAIYTLKAMDADGKPITKKTLNKDNLDQAVKSIRQQVERIVLSDLGKQVGWWYIQPEELRYWRKVEIGYLTQAVAAVHEADPEHRPVWMYDPNHRGAGALAHTAGTGMDIVGKGMYVNYAGMTDQRVWCRWTIEQEVEAIAKANPKAIPIAAPEMFQYKPANGGPSLETIATWARHDTYAALIAGAKGVVIFSMRQRAKFPAQVYDAYYKSYAKVATELNGKLNLGQVFLFGEKRHDLSVDVTGGPATVQMLFPSGGVKAPKTYPSLNFLDVNYKGERYLFIVNAANEPVEAMVDGLPYGNIQTHDLFGGEKPFRVAEGNFPVTLPALGVKGFRFEQGK